MKMISLGNEEYEKTVTSQFIELIPEHLHVLRSNFEEGAYEVVRKEMHRMISTLYIMGLNISLKNEIDAIVSHNLNRNDFETYLNIVIATCLQAKLEAEELYLTFS